MSPRCSLRCALPAHGSPPDRYTAHMDRDTEAQIAAARGYEPCPNCGSADVTWRGRRWHESLRRAIANVIEFPFRLLNSASRAPGPPGSLAGTQLGGLGGTSPGADQHRRLRQAFDSRVAAMKSRIWECRSCGKRGEMYPEYADLVGEYGGDLERLERSLPEMSRPDHPIGGDSPDNSIPKTSKTHEDVLR